MTDASVNFFWKKWCFKLFSHCCLSTVPSPGAPLMSKTFLCLKLCRQMSNSPHTRNSVRTGDEMHTGTSDCLPACLLLIDIFFFLLWNFFLSISSFLWKGLWVLNHVIIIVIAFVMLIVYQAIGACCTSWLMADADTCCDAFGRLASCGSWVLQPPAQVPVSTQRPDSENWKQQMQSSSVYLSG